MSNQLNTNQPADQAWHTLSAEEVAQNLDTHANNGLPGASIAERLEKYGHNELTAKAKQSALVRFLLEFNQPLIYILLVAGVVAMFLQDWVDAGVIFAVTLINAIIGFIQESKAENALAALAQSVATASTVVRDGQKLRLDSSELVPGDLVLLSSGDKVPADLRLVQVRDLQVSEAALTGESVPVQKSTEQLNADVVLADRVNMAYAGSLVTSGQARGLVIGTADNTETGRISEMMQTHTGLQTPLTRKLEQFSKFLLVVILTLAAFMFVVMLLKGEPWSKGFKAAVALAVSAIPEGLPAVVTVTLAIGVSRMASRHAIIRKLPAVETLGSTTVICSDKTGTLTENKMTVQHIYADEETYKVTGVGYDPQGEFLANDQPITVSELPILNEILLCGILCNDAHIQEEDGVLNVAGDPTEGALIISAQKAGFSQSDLEQQYPRIDSIPFESEYQYMATLHKQKTQEHNNIIYVKGSLESVLQRCQSVMSTDNKTVELSKEKIEQAASQLASQGLRVLAFAKQEVPKTQQDIDHKDIAEGLVFLGLQGIIDPPRAEAISAVKACQTAGIQVKMITGDHALTAAAIAHELGLTQSDKPLVYTGKQIADMADQQLAEAVEECSVFARVAPEQKLRLVKALQSKNEVVAMTGDGVNDAPALKQADIGVAMGITGTEVSKEAADMVLTDDNFASIEAAVEEGRTVYLNLLKMIGFILPVNGGEAMTILVGGLFLAQMPILAVQILWVNMVSSVALSATLAFEPKFRKIMQDKPRTPNEPLLSGNLLWRIVIISACNLLATFGMFKWVMLTTDNIDLARTVAVQTLVAVETFYLLSISQLIPSVVGYLRGLTKTIAYVPAIGVLSVLVLQFLFCQLAVSNMLFHTHALNLQQALLCIAAGIPVIIPALLLKRFAPLH